MEFKGYNSAVWFVYSSKLIAVLILVCSFSYSAQKKRCDPETLAKMAESNQSTRIILESVFAKSVDEILTDSGVILDRAESQSPIILEWAPEIPPGLPKLSPSDQMVLVRAFQILSKKGATLHEQELQRISEILVKTNILLLVKPFIYFKNKGAARDELAQAGLMAIHEALKRYDRTRESLFSTFAVEWIKKEMLRVTSVKFSEKKAASLTDSDGSLIDITDKAAPKDFAVLFAGDDLWEIRDRLALLTVTQREYVDLYYGLNGDPQNSEEIAKAQGISGAAVRDGLSTALRKLKMGEPKKEPLTLYQSQQVADFSNKLETAIERWWDPTVQNELFKEGTEIPQVLTLQFGRLRPETQRLMKLFIGTEGAPESLEEMASHSPLPWHIIRGRLLEAVNRMRRESLTDEQKILLSRFQSDYRMTQQKLAETTKQPIERIQKLIANALTIMGRTRN